MHARVQTERARMMIQSGRRESRDYVRGEVEPETSVVWNVRSVSRIGRCYLVSTLRNIPVGDRHRGVWPPYGQVRHHRQVALAPDRRSASDVLRARKDASDFWLLSTSSFFAGRSSSVDCVKLGLSLVQSLLIGYLLQLPTRPRPQPGSRWKHMRDQGSESHTSWVHTARKSYHV
jgi:hypothetical protein